MSIHMQILTFDTSSDILYTTLSDNGVLLSSKTVETTKSSYNSAHLIPSIAEIVVEKGLTLNDIDAIGVNIGPGSFTGIRASVSVAKVMANQLGIRVVGVSSLEIYSKMNNTEKNSLCLLDARRGQAYVSVYKPCKGKILEPCLLTYKEALDYAINGDFFVITDDKMSEIILKQEIRHIRVSDSDINFGAVLAELTYNYLVQDTKAQTVYSWQNLRPLYIQTPPV